MLKNILLTATCALLPVSAWAGEALEEMRERHLWLAYGVIWGLVFLFVVTTARRQRHQAQELAELAARVKELEVKDHD